MKDNDLREKIFLNPDDKDKMLDNMTRDADFLLAQNIMDYSLLVGIEKGIYIHNGAPGPAGETDCRRCAQAGQPNGDARQCDEQRADVLCRNH